MAIERIAVIGGGGHAAVAIATVQAMSRRVEAIFDDRPVSWGTQILGVPVVGPISGLPGSSCTHALCAIGDNVARRQVVSALDIEWTTAVHPFSWVHPDVPIGEGSVVFAGALVQPGAVIRRHVILNTKASVEHHCAVGDFAHVAAAQMGGASSIGDGVFLALGSTLLPGVRVGAWATVGAGAVVTKDVEAGVTVVGMPAKPLQKPDPVTAAHG